MKRHREEYFPVMEYLLKRHDTLQPGDYPIEITDPGRMALVLELIDIGYLDEESFTVIKKFRDISNLYYNGAYPFTDDGISILMERKKLRMKKIKITAYLAAVILLVLLGFFFIHLVNIPWQ